jgi:hypothetical protein
LTVTLVADEPVACRPVAPVMAPELMMMTFWRLLDPVATTPLSSVDCVPFITTRTPRTLAWFKVR